MSDETTYITCKNIDVAGTTPAVAYQKDDGTFEVRMGFAVLGSTNMTDNQFQDCDYNPFHKDFHDNYATGAGETLEEATAALEKDVSDICESIWAY